MFWIIGMGLLRGHPPMEMIRTGLTLAIGTIPEGLPTVVTLALACSLFLHNTSKSFNFFC